MQQKIQPSDAYNAREVIPLMTSPSPPLNAGSHASQSLFVSFQLWFIPHWSQWSYCSFYMSMFYMIWVGNRLLFIKLGDDCYFGHFRACTPSPHSYYSFLMSETGPPCVFKCLHVWKVTGISRQSDLGIWSDWPSLRSASSTKDQ